MTSGLRGSVTLAGFGLIWGAGLLAQQASPSEGAEVRVEVQPSAIESEVGQQLVFTARATDQAGGPLSVAPSIWFASPQDAAAADSTGTVTFYEPGTVQVGAVVQGGVGFATVTVKPARVARVEIQPLTAPLVVGGVVQLEATPRTANGNPSADAELSWTSDDPGVARVDPAGLVVGVAAGTTTVRASAESGTGSSAIQVIENPVESLTIVPASAAARTGDVVRFSARVEAVAERPAVRWAVGGSGATIDPDGGFLAERPGTYAVTATIGDKLAVASAVVTPRDVEREIQVVGRGPVSEFQAAEQWIIGKTAYLGSIADRVWIYDVSDPAHPVKTDSLIVDARIVNDVSTTADGRIGVLTREGASNRRNGIVFFDATDPLHPKVVSEYTETVTGGVHSAFIDGPYVYLTDDATGSLRVVDFRDVKAPREVARWQVENPLARTVTFQGQSFSAGRTLHDIYVKDGLIYLAYWKDGLVILDVGNGIKGGTPQKPQLVSQLRFNHFELYGPGWISGTHTVFRYEDYVFVGDEVLPAWFDIHAKDRIRTRGVIHVVDVSDLERPRKVAWYEVPEAGAHNVWVENDVLYLGCTYGGGGRVVDVSGELRGDLYAQGREIARVWTGDPAGFRPNLPATWGAQPHQGHIYFNDINSGLWITRLGGPRRHGSTTEPAP